jgi:predicted amidophosphoribosyltransferase
MALRFFELLILLILLLGVGAVIVGALLALTGRLQIGNYKRCPHCAERIQQAARICRYCQREVTGAEAERRPKGLFQ